MSIKYTYSIANDTLNGIVDSGALTEEIQLSNITIALDYINKGGDDCDTWFKVALSGAEQTTLSGVLAAHTGEPLKDASSIRIVDDDLESITEVNADRRLKVAIEYDSHDHNDLYYTISGTDTISGSLQDQIDNHFHVEGDITDLDKYTQAEVDALITTISGQLDDHNELNNLDYASSGHTGFQPAGDYATNIDLATVSGITDTNALNIATNSGIQEAHAADSTIHFTEDSIDKYTQAEVDALVATVSGQSGESINYFHFGYSDPNGIASCQYLKGSGGHQIGYQMIDPGSISTISINSIGTNNDVTIIDTYDSPVSYASGDIINVGISCSGTVPSGITIIDIESPAVCDNDILMLFPVDGDLKENRNVTNTCSGVNVMRGFNGRTHGGVDLNASGIFNSAASFDGVDDFIEFMHHKNYAIQDITLEFFFNTNDVSAGDRELFSKTSDPEPDNCFRIWQNSDDIKIKFKNVFSDKTIAGVLSTGTWYHIAAVFGIGGFKLFLDGEEIASDATTVGLTDTLDPIVLGAKNKSNDSAALPGDMDKEFDGLITEFRISDTRRYETTFSEIVSQFVKDSNTLGLWHFDETSGSIVEDSSDTITNLVQQATGSYWKIDSTFFKYGTDSLSHEGSDNDWSRIIHNSALETTEFTFDSWIAIDREQGGVIFSKGDYDTEGGIIIKYLSATKNISITYHGASTSRTLTSREDVIVSDTWYHVGVVITSDVIKLIFNGTVVDQETLTSDYQNVLTNNMEDIYLGMMLNQTEFLEVWYDDIRISNKALDFLPGTQGNPKQISVTLKT